MAAPGKENKEKKSGKDDAASAALRKISEELTALRSEVDALKTRSDSELGAVPKREALRAATPAMSSKATDYLKSLLKDDSDAVISMAYSYRITDSEGNRFVASDESLVSGMARILAADDALVARLGYALSSVPKVAILRILLTSGHQSAAQIGEKTNLTTGSLYHHLRELTHADVIESTVRNRFELTESGRQTVLLLFAQTAHFHGGA